MSWVRGFHIFKDWAAQVGPELGLLLEVLRGEETGGVPQVVDQLHYTQLQFLNISIKK